MSGPEGDGDFPWSLNDGLEESNATVLKKTRGRRPTFTTGMRKPSLTRAVSAMKAFVDSLTISNITQSSEDGANSMETSP
jgi:hypothetical protein